MNFKDIFIILVVLSTLVLGIFGDSKELPKWKSLLRQYRKWTGYYQFYNRPHACNMYVLSVQYDSNGGAALRFLSEGTVMNWDAISNDDQVVTMKKSTSFNNSDRFPVDQDFQTVGSFEQIGSIWSYIANITVPTGKGFQTINLHAMGEPTTKDDYTKSDRSFSLGLAVGIPVTLAVILMFTGVGIGIWAIKKGYLRHVPRAYKNFRNPSEPPQVSYERNEETNVHI